MEQITSFAHLKAHLKENNHIKRIAVANAADEHSVEAALQAVESGFAEVFLFGDVKQVPVSAQMGLQFTKRVHVVNVPDVQQATEAAVALVRNGDADVLMKGLVNTDVLLRAVLDREKGILPEGNIMSFCSVFEIPKYHKLLFFADAAVIPSPTLEQRCAIINYVTETARKFGVARPKIAMIHATEKANPKIAYMQDYLDIMKMHRAGDFGDIVLDGPLDILLALDKARGSIKKVDTPVLGDADGLVFPNFESANVFYKTLISFADAQMAGCLTGTSKPVVLTSRGDSAESKFNSIAMACALS
ncbi:MAG: phosphate butyryltransferase [Prevotellaceae bacterium]|jgi:phosphate butyryltransferase|nr:phosphate butyryltransferase [Prevotellaceae bacterium]